MQNDVSCLAKLLKAADENSAKKLITDYEDAILDNAEFLIANGVLVPPASIGDKFYSVLTEFGEWEVGESEIVGVCYESDGWYVESKDGEFWKVGTELCLLDRADAERILKEKSGVKED